ncbi:MAG: ankyrin repeat domain-containing protein [Ekhidna sp.]
MRKLPFLFLALLMIACSSISREEFNLMIESGDVESVKSSIDQLPEDQKAVILIESLAKACANANEEIALLLLENNAIGTSRAMMSACKNRMENVALQMFDSNDEIGDELDENGSSPLQAALAYGLPEVARKLLTVASQPVNMQSNFFLPPLHIAAEQGYVDIMALLIETRNADINLQNTDGMTAIFFAIKKGNADAVQYLVENGADLTIIGSFADSKYTPLEWANSSYTDSNGEIIEILSGQP